MIYDKKVDKFSMKLRRIFIKFHIVLRRLKVVQCFNGDTLAASVGCSRFLKSKAGFCGGVLMQ